MIWGIELLFLTRYSSDCWLGKQIASHVTAELFKNWRMPTLIVWASLLIPKGAGMGAGLPQDSPPCPAHLSSSTGSGSYSSPERSQDRAEVSSFQRFKTLPPFLTLITPPPHPSGSYPSVFRSADQTVHSWGPTSKGLEVLLPIPSQSPV